MVAKMYVHEVSAHPGEEKLLSRNGGIPNRDLGQVYAKLMVEHPELKQVLTELFTHLRCSFSIFYRRVLSYDEDWKNEPTREVQVGLYKVEVLEWTGLHMRTLVSADITRFTYFLTEGEILAAAGYRAGAVRR